MKKLGAIGVALCMLGQVGVEVNAAPNTRDDGWKFARSAPIKQAMKKVMGDKYPLLEQNTQLLNDVARSGTDCSSRGGIEGLYTSSETAFSFNTVSGKAQVLMLDGDDLNIWGAANKKALSPSMVQYIANLEMRRHGKKVNLLFEAPGKSTMNIEEASLVPVQKDLSLKTPTGRYLRDDKWDNATLDFKALDGNQVQFVLVANHGANVGEASGTVDLKGSKALYKGKDYELAFDYGGKSVTVKMSGSGAFGAKGVIPDGVYKKINDATPEITQ